MGQAIRISTTLVSARPRPSHAATPKAQRGDATVFIPQLGRIGTKVPNVRFGMLNLRAQDIVHQVTDSRVDFGLVRKNALVTGLKSASLGNLTYVAVVPEALVSPCKPPTLARFFAEYSFAMQTTEGDSAIGCGKWRRLVTPRSDRRYPASLSRR